ncbi:MAG: AAA domain-containing protein [Clostridia bacterium]|nr:AAA domain-containing protein [Clostridia bacterium]
MADYIALDAGERFSGRTSGTSVMGFSEPCEHTPKRMDTFIPPEWMRDFILWTIHSKEPVYITGPTGCGKTATVKQVASMLNYPMYEITGHSRLETPDLIGHFALVEGNTVWQDGPLTKAMRGGGYFLINEMDLLDPSTAAGLNTILDGSPLCIAETAEVVQPHPGFRFIATGNTNGAGDDSGLYTGTLRQNFALQNRFVQFEADYLTPRQERAILTRMYEDAGKLPAKVCDNIIEVARLVRAAFCGTTSEDESQGLAGLAVPMSTRSVLRWAEWAYIAKPLAQRGVNVLEYSMDRAFANAVDKGNKVVLHEVLQRVAGEESF